MSLAELHYTSAPEPGDGVSGARFTAVAPGVSPGLLKEIEPLLGYEPPRDAPPHPSAAELAALPRAFSHSVLSDGSRLLARAVCTGVDHSGRWCAFHTHAVLLPPGAVLPGGALPSAAWEAPWWASAAPGAGAAGGSRLSAAGGAPGQEELIAFARTRADRLEEFLTAVREVCEGRNTLSGDRARHLYLVEHDSTDVARWLGLAGAALPRECAERLTFTTYTRRPHLAPQQIVGVLPADVPALTGRRTSEGRPRILDGTAPAPPAVPGPAGPAGATPADTTATWAAVAARIWRGGAPGLFDTAARLPGGRFSAGALAAAALCGGVELGSDGRAEAAAWARMHARTLDAEVVDALVAALCAPAEERTPSESAALARLLGALGMTASAASTAPLGALVLTLAVRMPSAVPELPVARLVSLPAALKARLAEELADELRAGISGGRDTTGTPTLLRVAGVLGVDCSDLLPAVARQLANALLADPDGVWSPVVDAVLDEQFELRTALLSALDDRAAEQPEAAVRLTGRTSLALTGVQALPHLRMCAGAPWPPAPGGNRVTALHAALRAAGVSPLAEPLVLRTAVRLVWGEELPTAAEARQMLDETGSDAHRAAGTWRVLVRAALEAPGTDEDAPALAPDLLRCFPVEVGPRMRAALRLLDFAGALGTSRAAPPWVERALSLLAAAEQHGEVEPAVLDRLHGTLACRLLSEDRPDGELYALIHCGRTDLLAAYAETARTGRITARLRSVPPYAADCFAAWTSLPGANTAWDDTRTALLEKVLRPVVRALPAGDVAAVEQRLEAAGAHRAEEFRAWQRESALTRLGRRLGALGRRT